MAQDEILETDDFAERLQLALNGCNLSRSQLSATLGVHKSLVSRWLSGEVKPTSYNLARISEMLARLKPGFNMTLWTAPLAEFEAALGLQSVASASPVQSPQQKPDASRAAPGGRFSWRQAAAGSAIAFALVVAGFLLWRGMVERPTAIPAPDKKNSAPISAKHSSRVPANRAEALRLTQAARALIRERNRTSIAEAAHLLRQAVALDPNYAAAWARLGHATFFAWWYAEQSDPGAKLRLKSEALAYINRALAISPNLAEAQAVMGMVQGDTNEGLPWLERAVRLDPSSAEVWLWLGGAKREQGDLSGSLAAFETARELDPAWTYSAQSYVDLIFRLRGPSEAYRELDRAAASTNDQNWSRQVRADLEYSEGRLADSAALAVSALRAHPQNPYWARNRLVFIAALLGDKKLQDHMLAQDLMLRANFNSSHKPGWAYERAQSSADTWWDATLVGGQASQLISEGKWKLLVSLYDRRFKTAENFISHCPTFCNPISVAPSLIIALRKAGRSADANEILTAATQKVYKLQSAGDRLYNTEVSSARLAALSGETAKAKERLRDAIQRGWKGQDIGFPAPETDPVFENLRNDADFQAILKSLRKSQQAEAEKITHIDTSGI